MTPHTLDPTQRRVLTDLRDSIAEFSASTSPDDATVFDLLGTLGQARRLARIVPESGELLAVVREAEAALGARPGDFGQSLRSLRPHVQLDALAAALIDEEPEAAFDAMYDLDLTLCALESAGIHGDAASLRSEAVEIARLCAEPAPQLIRFASKFTTSLGAEGGAAEVWEAIAASEHRIVVDVPIEPAPAWLAPMLAADPLAGVLRMASHSPPRTAHGTASTDPVQTRRALAAAASMGGLAPSMVILERDSDAGWELSQRDAGPESQLVLRWLEGDGPTFAARDSKTAAPMSIVRPQSGNEAYIVCPPGVEVTLTVGDRNIRVMGPT